MLPYVNVRFSLLDIKLSPKFCSNTVVFSNSEMERKRAAFDLVLVASSEILNNYKQVKRLIN